MHWLDPSTVRLLHEESLAAFGGARGLRDEGLLLSALERPKTILAYGEGIDVFDLAAAYGYGLSKNHPIVDGNKRMAFLAMGVFLAINHYRLVVPQIEAVETILTLASGKLGEAALAQWLRDHSLNLSASPSESGRS